jgi:NAD+ synthase
MSWLVSTPRPMLEHDDIADVYAALCLGLADYVRKNGFSQVAIGLSGGIDSALTAAIAVDALGAGKVLGVFLPSPYTSRESGEDAAALAQQLGVRLETVPIAPMMQAVSDALAPLLVGTAPDTTEENVQARLRGLLLMAISNKYGHLLLTTGNKSELAVGYATLYGDMCGGFNVLKDVYKTQVFALCRWRNQQQGTAWIPSRILEKPPSAELKPNQRDQDSLPPYDVLDALLYQYIEQRQSVNEVISSGADEATARMVWTLLQRSEFKRVQSAPGVKVSPLAFGRDWRQPLTKKFTEF